jgi:hypothetical protein
MSWLFSQALVAEFSEATSWDGALSVPLSVMPTPHKFWRNDKTMEPSDLSRFGLTCVVLTAARGEALLTWFQAASLAKTSASRDEAQGWKAPDLGCGSTWRGSLARFDPASATWRTAQPSLLEDLGESLVTWPHSGMTAGGLCWELPMLGRRTSVIDSGLWPTVTVCGNYNRKGASATSGDGLITAIRAWPTPIKRDSRTVRGGGSDEWIAWNGAADNPGCRSGGRNGWPAEPDVGRMVDGLAFGMDRIAALGNGQVPRVAAAAWKLLTGEPTCPKN